MNRKQKDDKILKAARHAKIYQLIDTDQALRKVRDKLKPLEHRETKPHLWTHVFKIAAAVTIAVGLGWAIFQNQFGENWTTYVSGPEVKELKLPDGSLITINKNSTLQINQDMSGHRRLKLTGEAFFDVKRDEKRPFVVSSGEVDVKVLGTSFNIQSNNNGVKVSVAGGKVQVTEKGQASNSVKLSKNEAAVFRNATSKLQKTKAETNYLAWKTGIYTFNEASVTDALNLLARANEVKINFENPELTNCKITSVFDNQSWDEVVAEFALIHSLQFEQLEDGTVKVKGGNCE